MFRTIAIAAVLISTANLRAEEKPPPHFKLSLKEVQASKDDTALAKLLKERYNHAIDYAKTMMVRVETGQVSDLALNEAIDLLVGAGLELFSKREERIAVLEECLRFAQHAEKLTDLRYQAGIVPKTDVSRAKYMRATAEIRLLREKEAKH